VLDTCCAPGGFAQYLLDKGDVSSIKAFTLPSSLGVHKVFAHDPRLHVEEIDVTMLAGDIGLAAAYIPPSHPDAANFVLKNMINECEKFDLAICDGMVLRTHARLLYRKPSESYRLASTQFCMALQHVKAGGTMVILLHKPEAFHNVKLINQFSQFSQVTLFKPTRARTYTHRLSFYMVAKNIQPDHDAAAEILTNCKET
jgi:23S rRNA U2552 (ribose-2'-O)-methylase RlmE/FtsJ